uniref:ATP synthase subunit b, chloroplastic n=1 Tax=Pogonia minor TaxID=78837 RepID=A0A6G7KXC9_9ASPA|nr:CF0 subunit I [Pogonia minor]QII89999.1 CF0 subunit I [Pogonia minor]
MRNITDSLGHWSSAGSFELNTDILATNPINLGVVLGVLIFFGKGVYDLLDKRKHRILSAIRDSEELRMRIVEQLAKAQTRLRNVKIEADEYRMNGYFEIEREKMNLINTTCDSLERLETFKNETLFFEQQRTINQVRQQVFQQALQRALGILNGCLNSELHIRTISSNIGILGSVEQIID